MTRGTDVEDMTRVPSTEGSRGVAVRPPAWVFHGLLAVAALPILWSASVPGVLDGWALLGWVLWVGFAVAWLVRLVLYVQARRRLSWWFLVAPVMFVVLASLLAAHVPLKVRWSGSHDAFDAALARVAVGPTGVEVRTDETVGSYRIVGWRQVSEYGVLFVEETRAGWPRKTNAGFAFLPGGPGAPLLLETIPLGDGWYAWSDVR